MDIELNQLVRCFTENHFRLKGVHHFVVEPGTKGWQRTSPFPGFIFPLSGRAEFCFNGTPYIAYPGNVIHGGGDMSLDKRVLGSGKWELIFVPYEFLSSDSEINPANLHFELKTGQSRKLTELLWKIWKASDQPGALSSFRCEMLFRCILEEVFMCVNRPQSEDAQELFESVSAFIHENYMNEITVSGLAEQNGVNENRLFYVFSKHAGMGPGDYLTAYRLNRAKELLITTDSPIGEVASRTGYFDPLYFSRIFRKRFGFSPSAVREQYRKNPNEFCKICPVNGLNTIRLGDDINSGKTGKEI
ncbi:MAG: helix-turn-helix transcriptional regulator [Deferribacterales bacterium]